MTKNFLSIAVLATAVCLAVAAPAAKKDAPAAADAGKEEKIEGRGGLFGGGPIGYAGGFPGHLGGAAFGHNAGGYQGGFAGGAQGFNQGSAGFAGGDSSRNVQGYNSQMGYSSNMGFSKTDSNRYGTGYGQHSGGFAGGAAGHQGGFGQSGFGQVGGIGHY